MLPCLARKPGHLPCSLCWLALARHDMAAGHEFVLPTDEKTKPRPAVASSRVQTDQHSERRRLAWLVKFQCLFV